MIRLKLVLSISLVSCILYSLVEADKPFYTDLSAYQDGALGHEPRQTFHSSPLVAPVYQINKFDAEKVDTKSPYIFMAGRYGGWGPSIVSSKDLSLVWADQRFGGVAQATHGWEFYGQRVLAVFVGDAIRIYSQAYEELYVVTTKGEYAGTTPDSHEATLTENNTVLLIACPAVEVDLSSVGGPKEGKKVANCVAQEIDPVTDELLFQFATLDYFDVTDSVWEYHGEGVWDFCHMNSVQKTPEGNFLISYRHLSTVILVNGTNAEVIWVMWGKKNQFTDITKNGSAEFHYQHQPRVSGENRFTLFDNHRIDNGYCTSGQCSRGLEIGYDPDAKTVWMINEWYHPQALVSGSRGGVQRTPSGNVLVAWGQNPMFTEYTANGELVMDIQRGQVLAMEHGIVDVIAYRAWKGDWEGKPTWGPNISCSANNTGKFFYVSWNGATNVDRYVLLSSNRTDDLNGTAKVVDRFPRTGFETEFYVSDAKIGSYGRIAALDVNNQILGSTPAVNVSTGELLNLEYNITQVSASSASHVSMKMLGLVFGGISATCIALISAVVIFRRRQSKQQPRTNEDDQGLLDSDDFELGESFMRDSEDSENSTGYIEYKDKNGR